MMKKKNKKMRKGEGEQLTFLITWQVYITKSINSMGFLLRRLRPFHNFWMKESNNHDHDEEDDHRDDDDENG